MFQSMARLPNENDLLRGLRIGKIRKWLPENLTDDEGELFEKRMRWF